MISLISFIVLISFFITFFSLPKIREFGLYAKLTDVPNRRKKQTKPVVRIGGFGILIGSILSICISNFIFKSSNLEIINYQFFSIIFIPSLLFFVIGLLDDIFSISALIKLCLQFAASFFIWLGGFGINQLDMNWLGLSFDKLIFPAPISLIITFLWIGGVVNAINWLDGMDGLLAGISIILNISIIITSIFNNQVESFLWASALLGSCIAYLIHNLKSNYIYMGDCGSYFIGANLAILTIIGKNSFSELNNNSNLLLGFLIIGIPILDMLIVIYKRIKDGFSPFYPDRNHLHHRLLKLGMDKKEVLFSIYIINIWFNSIVFLIHYFSLGLIFLISSSGLIFLKYKSFRRN